MGNIIPGPRREASEKRKKAESAQASEVRKGPHGKLPVGLRSVSPLEWLSPVLKAARKGGRGLQLDCPRPLFSLRLLGGNQLAFQGQRHDVVAHHAGAPVLVTLRALEDGDGGGGD